MLSKPTTPGELPDPSRPRDERMQPALPAMINSQCKDEERARPPRARPLETKFRSESKPRQFIRVAERNPEVQSVAAGAERLSTCSGREKAERSQISRDP